MKKLIFLIILSLSLAGGVAAQGIKFFEGTFDQALKTAQEQNKRLFVDFYAVWCGPCRQMSNEVFTDAKVGEYFNSKFICCKYDAEKPDMKARVDTYSVKAYPTIVIIEPDGAMVTSHEGSLTTTQLLKWAKTVMDDILSFEQMYEQLKTDKTNKELVRELLVGAPDFIASQEGSSRERWMLRIERLYADYRKQNQLGDLMNNEDFQVLTLYHTEPVKNDVVVEYVMANYDDVIEKVDQNSVNGFIFSLYTLLIQDMAQKGDMEYEKYLERIRDGKMKQVYDAMMKSGDIDTYTLMKYLNDGLYYIYNRKNVEKYISLTDEYLTKLGSNATAGDFSSAIQTLYDALDGKLPATAATKGVEWISKALQFESKDVGERMELLIMNGDCYKMLKDADSAKKCYNQAYVISLQFNNPGLSAQIQNMITNI